MGINNNDDPDNEGGLSGGAIGGIAGGAGFCCIAGLVIGAVMMARGNKGDKPAATKANVKPARKAERSMSSIDSSSATASLFLISIACDDGPERDLLVTGCRKTTALGRCADVGLDMGFGRSLTNTLSQARNPDGVPTVGLTAGLLMLLSRAKRRKLACVKSSQK